MDKAYVRDVDKPGEIKIVSAHVLEHKFKPIEQKVGSTVKFDLHKLRFYCPNCGETAYFHRARAGATGELAKPHFAHQDSDLCVNPDCDLRVNSTAMTINGEMKRKRNAIFLMPDPSEKGVFILSVGFTTPKSEKGKLAAISNSRKAKLVLSLNKNAANIKGSIPVSDIINTDDDTVFIPIEEPIRKGASYSLFIQSEDLTTSEVTLKEASIVSESLGNDVDWFAGKDAYGAIFDYATGASGEKIRTGGKVASGRPYLMMVKEVGAPVGHKSFEDSFLDNGGDGAELERVGISKAKGSTSYIVYRAVFPSYESMHGNTSKYLRFCDMLEDRFGVVLCDRMMEILPVWPPAIRKGINYTVSNAYWRGDEKEDVISVRGDLNENSQGDYNATLKRKAKLFLNSGAKEVGINEGDSAHPYAVVPVVSTKTYVSPINALSSQTISIQAKDIDKNEASISVVNADGESQFEINECTTYSLNANEEMRLIPSNAGEMWHKDGTHQDFEAGELIRVKMAAGDQIIVRMAGYFTTIIYGKEAIISTRNATLRNTRMRIQTQNLRNIRF